MWLYISFLIQFTLTIIVRSEPDSLFDNDASEGMDWDFSDVDLAATTSLFSSEDGDGFISPGISGSTPANEQSLDWFANAGSPCISDVHDFQSIGKLRAARRDGVCHSGPSKTGERKTGEDPSNGSSNSKPIEIPNSFTAPTGEPYNMFYPSENQDECPPSVYGPRKTPMCDSGFGDDFMKYSVLGFVALEIIEGCLPCTCIKLCRDFSSDLVWRAHRCNQGAHYLAVPIRGWSGAASRIFCPMG